MIVCDGFMGNVALKVSEGLVDMVSSMLRESLRSHHRAQDRLRALATAFRDFKKRLDYSEYGGAPLLGREGRLHHLPRPVECQCDQECDPGGGGIFRRATSIERIEEELRGVVKAW